MRSKLTLVKKIQLVYNTIDNPFNIIFDKTGLQKDRKTLFKTRNGMKFYTRSGTTDIDEAIVILSGFEYPKKSLGKIYRKKPLIIDVGAHIGLFSIYIKNIYPCAQIIAIEPLEENLKLMAENLTINKITDVKILKLALTEKNGEVFIYLPQKARYDTATTVLKNSTFCIKQIVVSKTLKSILCDEKIKKVDLLKLDIEGIEFKIIKNNINLIKRTINNLLVEYHSNKDSEMRNKIINILLSHGFKKNYEHRHVLSFTNSRIIK